MIVRLRVPISIIGFLIVSCASSKTPTLEPTQTPATQASQTSAPKQAPEAASAPVSAAPAPAAPETPKAQPDLAFPPQNISPPFERSASPDDGKWLRLGDANSGDRAGKGVAVFYKTTLHPHPSSKFLSATIAAVDLRRTRVRYVPGFEDAKPEQLPPNVAPGLIPSADHAALLAVFNGGFKPAHGRWGMMLDDHVIVPPRKEGCTVAVLKDESMRIESWPKLENLAAQFRAYRQTPPCLLEAAKLHPKLEAHNEKPWGGNVPNLVTRRRSAVGIDASGKILLYAYGEELGPRLLADALRLAGAVSAAELDINWYWTRFLLFGEPPSGGELQVTSTLVPKMEHQRTGYVRQKSDRDFFYLLARTL